MKKILIIPTTDWLRDIPFRMRFIADRLSHNYEIHVLGLNIYSNYNRTILQDNLFVHYLPYSNLFYKLKNKEIIIYTLYREKLINYAINIVKNYNIDTIIISNPILFSSIYTKYSNVIFDIVDYYPEFLRRYVDYNGINKVTENIERMFDIYLTNNILRRTDVLVFSNYMLYKYYKTWISVNSEIINNGYESNIFNENYIIRNSYKLFSNKAINKILQKILNYDIVILFIGTLEYWIDYDFMINYYTYLNKLLRKRGMKTLFLIIGTGPKLNYLKSIMKNKHNEDIILVGKINYNLVPFFVYLSDVLFIPFKKCKTSFLSFPLKALEALALRRKVLFSNTPILRAFKNCHEVNVISEKRIERAIDFIISDFDNDDKHIISQLSWDNIARKYDKLISNL